MFVYLLAVIAQQELFQLHQALLLGPSTVFRGEKSESLKRFCYDGKEALSLPSQGSCYGGA